MQDSSPSWDHAGPFVDQVDTAELHEGAVVLVDSRFGRDLASAHPMDAALRRIHDEHLALRVDLSRKS